MKEYIKVIDHIKELIAKASKIEDAKQAINSIWRGLDNEDVKFLSQNINEVENANEVRTALFLIAGASFKLTHRCDNEEDAMFAASLNLDYFGIKGATERAYQLALFELLVRSGAVEVVDKEAFRYDVTTINRELVTYKEIGGEQEWKI